MARYIDADEAILLLESIKDEKSYLTAINAISKTSTADVAEVVRCKDCEFRDGSACEYSAVWVHPNGYCHWGRKEEENDKIH